MSDPKPTVPKESPKEPVKPLRSIRRVGSTVRRRRKKSEKKEKPSELPEPEPKPEIQEPAVPQKRAPIVEVWAEKYAGIHGISLPSEPKSTLSERMQLKFRTNFPQNRGYMKVYVKIDRLEPFVIKLSPPPPSKSSRKIIEHYIKQHYFDLYQGGNPGELFLNKILNFNNGDKMFLYKRKESNCVLERWILTLEQLKQPNLLWHCK